MAAQQEGYTSGESSRKDKESDKLAQEVSQAIAAGMSYGRWKAMQPAVEIQKKPSVFEQQYLTCAYCGCQFVDSMGRRMKYCGDRCKARAAAQRAGKRGGA
jgi:Tfp pilus assembly protein PilE